MIRVGPNHVLLEPGDRLPIGAVSARRLYLDCETRRRGDELTESGNEPWLGDRACGWAVTWDDHPDAYYLPIRHRDQSVSQLPIGSVNEWLRDALAARGEWVNHNVKFDAHFAAADGAISNRALVDTLTQAKIVNSDRMSHGLKDLLRDWLNVDQVSEDRIVAFLAGWKLPRNRKARDYALVPPDIMAGYACDDVLNNRALHAWLDAAMPEQCVDTWRVERELTPILWRMERRGLRVDSAELQIAKLKSMQRQIALATKIAQVTGTEWVDSSTFSLNLFVSLWGMPVLAHDKKSGNPTFNEDALLMYLGHPEIAANPGRRDVVQSMIDLRHEETYCSLYVDKFLEIADERGFIHPSYNQVIRTGRMSCSNPNSQQFNERAKRLIHPDDGNSAFFCSDASQIEFRVIVHYIKDEACIAAYRANPRTDFHQWVADLCRIKRKPAKTMNFAMAYGAGKRRAIAQMVANEDIISEVYAAVDAAIADGRIHPDDRLRAFMGLVEKRGQDVYSTYHEKLPGLRTTSKSVEAVARIRGFVFNVFGRRRHLPPQAAHVGFNTLCQSSASDIVKRKMIELDGAIPSSCDVRINVHDEIVVHGPRDALSDPKFQALVAAILEAPIPQLRVPIAWESSLKLKALHEEAVKK